MAEVMAMAAPAVPSLDAPLAWTQEFIMEQARQARRPAKRSRTLHEHLDITQTFSLLQTAVVAQQLAIQNAQAQEQPKAPVLSQLRRPRMPPPRRSYSVTDHEPVPPEQRPSTQRGLMQLPTELHFMIAERLEPIDATCLGLTSKHFYSIHRRVHGTVPLTARREGPNESEWAWHMAGRKIPASLPATPATVEQGKQLGFVDDVPTPKDLKEHRVRGKGLCRKCGIARCELHRHLRDWVPAEYEYCGVRRKFVQMPGEVGKGVVPTYCSRVNPNQPSWCGRHVLDGKVGDA